MGNIYEELGINFSVPVRDPLWGNILFPEEFSAMLSCPDFVKLSRIMQLGPGHLIYPGATHTRKAHSIGVFEMAKRLLGSVSQHSDVSFLSTVDVKSFLAAALCHDLGHFPYAHSLKELPLCDHECLTGKIVSDSMSSFVSKSGADPELVAAIVDKDIVSNSRAITLFRHMLSGVLDPDKLDYLNRDAWACGVPYGTQDVDFIIRHYGLDTDGRPGIDDSGIMAVEAVLFSKYQMYKAVYWHKMVRSATAMIKAAVIDALATKNVYPEELYGLDDAGFYRLMVDEKRDKSKLIESVFNGKLFPACYELSFNPNLASHSYLIKLDNRKIVETELKKAFKIENVIIDIPEPISFESDIPIIGKKLNFSSSSTVFKPELVSAFTSSLRIIRVFCSEQVLDSAKIISDLFSRLS